MDIIKLGDRISIPSKNTKGEVAYIGKTHFADGMWFGIILDDPIGKHNGTIDEKCYFKSEKNHGIFLKASYFERESFDIISAVDKRCSLVSKRLKYSSYPRVPLKQKTATTSAASNCITNSKMKAQSQCESVNVTGDNVTNINVENKELMKITGSGDNCDFKEKRNEIVSKNPNYLKASCRVTGNNFCLNKNKGNKTVHDTGGVACNDKKLMLPTADSNDNPDKYENESPKRIVYSNYVKASSKLAGKHFCEAKRNDINYDETPEKTLGIRTTKGYGDNKVASENPHAYLIKYPHHSKTSSDFKENKFFSFLCSERKKEMSKPKLMSTNEDCKIPENDHIKDFRAELEAMKHENEDLKRKLKRTEAFLEEIVNKYNESQEENKHLKCDNECQREQIKFQKNHLKLLKMGQGSNFKETVNNKASKQKKIDEILEIILNKHGDGTNISGKKCDLENLNVANSTQRVLKLEEQNRLIIQEMVELRNVLKKQCESQCIELEPSNSNNRSSSQRRNHRKHAFSKSFDLPIINSEATTNDESSAQSREYSEMLREMTKFNELIKEKRENVKDWLVKNSVGDDKLLANIDLSDTNHPIIQSGKSSSYWSTFDINDEIYGGTFQAEMDSEAFQNSPNSKSNNIQKNCQTSSDQNCQHFSYITKMKGNINKRHTGDEVSFEPIDCIHKMSHEMPTENLIYDEGSSPNTTLIGQEDFDNEVPEYAENYSSEVSEAVTKFPVDLSYHSTNTIHSLLW